MQQHCEPEDLAMLALGEQIQPCQEHVAGCPQCVQEFDQLREVVTLGRASGGPESLTEPPPELWETYRVAVGHRTDRIADRHRSTRRPHLDPATRT